MAKLCECGCGQTTSIAPYSWARRGWVRGEPMRFVHGHTAAAKRQSYVSIKVAGRSWFEHTLIAARALGKPLPPGAQVHHVDGNKRNNAPNNLVICQDASYHQLLHERAKTIGAGGDPNTQRLCVGCSALRLISEFGRRGRDIPRRRSRCRSCMAKAANRRYHARKRRKEAA